MTASWHTLLADIPKDARINRRSAVATELAKPADTTATAGWEALSVELFDGSSGLRHLAVTLDARGRPLSANDLVLFRRALDDGRIEVRTESLGGRIEADGRFFGTRWTSIGYDDRSSDADAGIESTPSIPSDVEVDKLLALVKDIAKRRPPKPLRLTRGRGRAAKDRGS